MEIIQQFYDDNDEEKFLQRCDEIGLEYRITESTDIKRVYQMGGSAPLAVVEYSPTTKTSRVFWFTCNFALYNKNG